MNDGRFNNVFMGPNGMPMTTIMTPQGMMSVPVNNMPMQPPMGYPQSPMQPQMGYPQMPMQSPMGYPQPSMHPQMGYPQMPMQPSMSGNMPRPFNPNSSGMEPNYNNKYSKEVPEAYRNVQQQIPEAYRNKQQPEQVINTPIQTLETKALEQTITKHYLLAKDNNEVLDICGLKVSTKDLLPKNNIVTDTIWLSDNLRDTIYNSRSNQLETHGINYLKAKSTYLEYMTSQVLTAVDLTDIVNGVIIASTDIVSLADNITSAYNLAEEVIAKEENTEVERLKFLEEYKFAKALDKQLTDIVNDYLKYNLELTVTIDCFSGDIKALVPYLAKHNTSIITTKVNDYLQVLHKEITYRYSKAFRESCGINDEEEGEGVSNYLITGVCMTLLPINNSTHILEHDEIEIDALTCNEIHEFLVASGPKAAKEVMNIYKHYVLTLDDVLYRCYHDELTNKFTLKKVKLA